MTDEHKDETEVNLIAGAIEAAEIFTHPLEGLVERSVIDPGAPFDPDALESIAALKKENPAAFELLRSQLKKAGCRVTALDEAIAQETGEVGGGAPKQADILIQLAEAAELFHAPDGTGYADLDINGHRETWPIRARGFRRWLARRFYDTTGGAPGSEALQSALNVIEARADFDGPERVVHIRVGGLDGSLYLDLADEKWRAIEIDATGWRILDKPPVRFRRASGMQPLPVPMPGGSVEILRSFLNVQSDGDFVLVVAWALAVLSNRGPYPALVLSGEQGPPMSEDETITCARHGVIASTAKLKRKCGAQTRRGTPCQCKPLANGRCKFHGGLSNRPEDARMSSQDCRGTAEALGCMAGTAARPGQRLVGSTRSAPESPNTGGSRAA
jgi:hypothetical protein